MQTANNNQAGARNDDFSGTVERILTTVEQRGEDLHSSQRQGPLTTQEISNLSMLCSLQASRRQGLAEDLGFTDVDPDMTGQLVEYLEKHVASASGIDIIREAYALTQTIKKKKSSNTMDQWLQNAGLDRLRMLRNGLEAATISLFIINSPGIDPRVISEDAIEASIVLFRHNISKNILPALNQVGHIVAAMNKTEAAATPASAKKRRRNSAGGGEATVIRDMKKVYRHILTTVGLTVLVIERLDALIQKIPLDDQQLLTISSGALISLELDPSNESGVKITHQLHVATTGVVTSIFRKYSRHRQIIVEDLFPIMLRMPTSKKSMRTFPVRFSSVLFPSGLHSLSKSLVPTNQDAQFIQTLSAVIMGFVQSSVVRPALEASASASAEEAMPMPIYGAAAPVTPPSPPPQLISGLRECQATSDLFVKLLLKRCSKKGEDGGASEFRPILSNLIDDLLLVLLVPEYPAAETILLSITNMISRDLMKATSPKAIQNAEATYLSTAFDALGKICAAEARILKSHRERPVCLRAVVQSVGGKHVECYCKTKSERDMLMLNCDRCQSWYHGDCVGLNRETVPQEWFCDACQLGRIVEFENDRNTNLGDLGCSPDLVNEAYCMRRLLIDYLSIVARKSGVVGIQDAYEFHLARWLSGLNLVGQIVQSANGDEITTQISNMPLISRLMELWDPRESSDISKLGSTSLSGMLHCLSDEGRSRMMVHLSSNQSTLLVSFKSQIGLIVKLMSSNSSALLRKLAVKAIEKVSDADKQLMLYSFIKKAVTQRFSDEAISVREAAVSLVGSYVVHSPAVANAFHPAFMVGLNDSGVSVRKRTIKILQDILCSNPGYKGRAEACSEMLRLAADPKEDDGVRDLIHDLFMKVWLENGDQAIVQETASPIVSPSIDQRPKTPGSYVEGLEMRTPAGIITPTPHTPFTPSPSKNTRSSDKFIRRKRLQVRSEIAAEQMVEVVKAANTEENLTALFRELLSGVSDADKDRRASERKKRKVLAQGHCAMLVDSLFEILLSMEENRNSFKTGVGKEMVAIIRTIKVFTDVSPEDVLKHLDTLLPYLKADNGLRQQEETLVVGSLCDILSRVALEFTKEDVERLGNSSVAKDLVNITYKFGREALSSAVHALCALAHNKDTDRESRFRTALLALAQGFYTYLLKHRKEEDFASKTKKAKANIQRALSVLGSICRYHESSLYETMDEEDSDEEEDSTKALDWANLTTFCERMFAMFLEKNDPPTKCSALRGLCGVFIACPREMLRMDQSGLISDVMSPGVDPSVQLESLWCWRDILLTEEARIESGEAKAKMDSKKNITLSKKISGDQDADATLFGGVLTNHAARLFEITQVRDKKLRFASLDLIGHLLRQGQVNPNETVPFLLALQGDVEEDDIRSLALKLLRIEGEKRPDMLRQRVRAGVKQAYLFQKSAYPDNHDVSALIKVKKNGIVQTECVFGSVFKECIVSIKKQRHGLFRNLLGLFDMHNRKSSETNGPNKAQPSEGESIIASLPLLSFTSQVLAFLPYSAASDPLYIIHHMTSTLALQGPDLLDQLATFLRPHGLSSSDELDENNASEDALEIAAKRNAPCHAKEVTPLLEPDFDTNTFSRLCAEAGALTLLLRLKTFLRKAYNLTESRCLSYSPDAKERVAEKAISRASVLHFDSKLAMQSSHGYQDMSDIDRMIFQYAGFRQLMRAESAVDSRSDDSDDEDLEKNNKRKRIDSDLSAGVE